MSSFRANLSPLKKPDQNEEEVGILYPHGFLYVVLSDDLSRAVHVPLQTSYQFSVDKLAGVKKLQRRHKWNKSFKQAADSEKNMISFALLVCQSAGKVVLDVGIYYWSVVVEPAVPEQVNDEHLSTYIHVTFYFHLIKKSHKTWFGVWAQLRSSNAPTRDWKTSGPYLSVLSSKRQKSVSRTSLRNCDGRKN